MRVQRQYNLLIETLGAELDILRNVSLSDIDAVAGACVAEAVRRLRNGKVDLQPGYDGEYGRVALLSAEDRDAINGQVALFSGFGQADTSKKRSKRSAAAKADSSASKDRIDKKESTDIFAELSEEQLKAVCSSNSTTVVTAGPGSGKTKTLVSRICWLLEKQSIKPENITAVTFTNKAAAELKDRISRQYQSDGKNIINKMHIGTFHSICLEMLREKGKVLPVLDPVEAASLAADLAFNIEGLGKDAYGVINRYKNGITKNLNENEQALLVSYEQELSNWGVMDLDDILLHVLKADDWDMSKFSHLLVDEFQDINEIQHQLIKKWSADSDSLFVIGDADQSIYGFRGANANCFDRLAAEKSQLNMVSLNCNYRSTPQIVEFAHPLSSTYSNTEVKTVRSEGDAVHSYRCVSQYDEASFISQEIINLVGGIDMISAAMQRQGNKNIGFADIAVLARTHKQLDIIADVLKENGIACRIAGRDSVLTSSYIRDALAWFRWMYNPADMISLRRLLRSADIPDAECALLLEKFRKTGSKSIAALLKLCKEQKAEDAKEVVATAAYLANRLYRDNAEKLLQSYIDARFLGGVEELEQLMSMAVTYSDMRSLLQAVTMGEEIDVQRSNGKKYNADAVLLSTLHGSKGLEFPIVFLAGVKEGTMPLKRDNDAVDLAEEQRLFYVGMTRAMDKLYLLLSDPQSVFISKLSMHNVVDINNTYRHRTKKQQLSLF